MLQRDAFEWSDGGLRVGRVRRYSVDELEDMFIPRMTAEGKRVIRQNSGFVESQLKHYGISYDKNKFRGNGVDMLKEALEDGHFDSVPTEVLELEQQMRREDIRGRPLSELICSPGELIECHFLDAAGKPDKTITPDGLALPLPRHSTFRAGLLARAISRVPGLMSVREDDLVLIGWDETAIAKARTAAHSAVVQAEEAARRAEEAARLAGLEREQSRTDRHEMYLSTLIDPQTRQVDASPVGRYVLQCAVIEWGWPETQEEDMYLDITTSGQADVYDASFDVGVATGPMISSGTKEAIASYMADMDDGSESEDDSEEDEANELEAADRAVQITTPRPDPIALGAGQKRSGVDLTAGTSKKPKVLVAPTTHFHTLYKHRETGEGVIDPEPVSGHLTFKDDRFATFEGNLDMSQIGNNVVIHGRKISDVPCVGESWEDYSWDAHEYARVARWR